MSEETTQKTYTFTNYEFDLICEGLNELLTNKEELLEMVEERDKFYVEEEIADINRLLDRL